MRLIRKQSVIREPQSGLFPTTIALFAYLAAFFFLSPGLALDAPPEDLPRETLVIYNSNDPDGPALAHYYASKRKIPTDRVISLDCPLAEEISRNDYDRTIAGPLRKIFERRQWWTVDKLSATRAVTSNKIRFIALVRGLPLKIRNQEGYPGDQPDPRSPIRNTNAKAVDSELATLGFFRRQISGPLENPYFRKMESIRLADPRLMLVARLDASSAAEVRRMIDDSIEAESNGLRGWTYLDIRGTLNPAYKVGDDWLHNIKQQSFAVGFPAIIDQTGSLFPRGYPMTDAMFYFGWYSDHPVGVFTDPRFRFRPGAIAVHIYSFSASSIREPPESWVSCLINHGAAASLGNVYEPYLQLTPMLDLFHDRLLSGMTLAESAYASLVAVSWMTTVVGDPLYRPFRNVDTLQDPATEWDTLRTIFLQDRDGSINLVPDLQKKGAENPLFLEVAGLVLQERDESDAAVAAFEAAFEGYGTTAEGFRSILGEATLLRELGRQTDLASLVQRALTLFQDPDQQTILRSYLQRM
jgi:uncharacterized protein (TIGR03790 family)